MFGALTDSPSFCDRAQLRFSNRVKGNILCVVGVRLIRKMQFVAVVREIYLVMEYQSGGELFSYLKEQGTFTEVWSILHLLTQDLFDSRLAFIRPSFAFIWPRWF